VSLLITYIRTAKSNKPQIAGSDKTSKKFLPLLNHSNVKQQFGVKNLMGSNLMLHTCNIIVNFRAFLFFDYYLVMLINLLLSY